MGPARAVTTALRGIAAAVRRRPATVLAVVLGVFALHVLLPPLLLAVTRKPWTYFTFNPWLAQLPSYLSSGAPLEQKLDFLSRVAVFWFSADGAYLVCAGITNVSNAFAGTGNPLFVLFDWKTGKSTYLLDVLPVAKQHGLHEVLAIGAEDPGCAEDQCIRTGHRVLS